MASELGLVALPVEILDSVVSELAFHDICNLRLVSREVAASMVQTTYSSYFATKRLEMSKECLETFSAMTRQAWLSSALRHLTIVGLVHRSKDEHDILDLPENEALEHLMNAFSNLRPRATCGRVCSLNLEIKCLQHVAPPSMKRGGPVCNWLERWNCGSVTARLVAEALRASELEVERLDLYGTTERCALGPGDLGFVMNVSSTRMVKTLSLTICTSYDKTILGTGGLPALLASILQSMVHLESLEIRWFSLRFHAPETELEDRDILASIAAMPTPLPHLKHVALRGIYTTQYCLLAFLRAYPLLTSLVLEHIHLSEGQFIPIFSYIDEHMKLGSLHLNDMYEKSLIQFLGVSGEGHFPLPRGPTWMRRTAKDRWRRIRYQLMTGRIRGSPQADRWYLNNRMLYGPC